MIEMQSDGIFEIGKKGRVIQLIYKTEKDAMNALMEHHVRTGKEFAKMFPEGVF